ncbi:MAG TPA: hypothetical protein VH062_15410 [Polyangiaceae bacterium]|nr:hypothetical protein [Polyangiaceae bacterium]
MSVSGGTLKSSAVGFLSLDAMVVGKLDCQTGVFSGQIVGGEVSIPPFPPGGTFTGDLTSSFDQAASTLAGTWHLIGGDTFQGASCAGPWNATYQGP